MERPYIDRRKDIRQVWKWPYRTHNSLLPRISNSVPPDICYIRDLSILFPVDLHSDNNVANFIFNLCLRGNSRMWRNVRFIARKYNFIFNNLKLIKEWSHQIHHHNEEDIRISTMISELIHQRYSFHPSLLKHHECSDIINYFNIISFNL